MRGGRSARQPEPSASTESAREWRCDVCDEAAVRVVGVAAVVAHRLRLWLGGCCRSHEDEVREQRKLEAREFGVPEITVTQVLRPDEVAGWMQRMQRELTGQV